MQAATSSSDFRLVRMGDRAGSLLLRAHTPKNQQHGCRWPFPPASGPARGAFSTSSRGYCRFLASCSCTLLSDSSTVPTSIPAAVSVNRSRSSLANWARQSAACPLRNWLTRTAPPPTHRSVRAPPWATPRPWQRPPHQHYPASQSGLVGAFSAAESPSPWHEPRRCSLGTSLRSVACGGSSRSASECKSGTPGAVRSRRPHRVIQPHGVQSG